MTTLRIVYDETHDLADGLPARLIEKKFWLTNVEWVHVDSKDVYYTWDDVHTKFEYQDVAFYCALASPPLPTTSYPVDPDTGATIVPPAKWLSLLFVKAENREARHYLVERAYLLGEDGATIDRIAP